MNRINLVVDIVAMQFVLIMMIGSFFRTGKKKGLRMISFMFLTVLLMLFLNALNALGKEMDFPRKITRMFWLTDYFTLYVLSVEYDLFCLYYLGKRKEIFSDSVYHKCRKNTLIVACVVFFFQVFLSAGGKWIVILPWFRNDFTRVALLLQVTFGVPILMNTYVLLRYRNVLQKKQMLILLILQYCAIPFYFIDLHFHTTFLCLAIALEVSLIYIYIVTFQEQKMQLLEKQIEENRAELVAVQIHPHFLLNSLVTVRALCKKHPDDAIKALDFLSIYMHGILRTATRQENVTIQQEMEFIQAYIAIEQLRYGEKLNVCYEIENVNFSLPGLCVQPLVENAIRHGIMQKKGGGTVTIRVKEENEAYLVEVEDDGVGYSKDQVTQKKEWHVGIQNVKERLQYSGFGNLKIQSELQVGTKATIYIYKARKGKTFRN